MDRIILILYVLHVAIIYVTTGLTREQVKNTMAMMKTPCMLKHSASSDEVDQIEQGVFIEDHNVMCYISCIYMNIQVLRSNRLDKDLFLMKVDILYPQDLREPVKRSINKCISVQNLYEDTCEGIFYATRCLYADDPSKFIFP